MGCVRHWGSLRALVCSAAEPLSAIKLCRGSYNHAYIDFFFFLNNCSVLVPLKGLYVFLIKNKINIKRVVRGAVGRKPILYWLFGLEVDSQKQFMRNSRP